MGSIPTAPPINPGRLWTNGAGLIASSSKRIAIETGWRLLDRIEQIHHAHPCGTRDRDNPLSKERGEFVPRVLGTRVPVHKGQLSPVLSARLSMQLRPRPLLPPPVVPLDANRNDGTHFENLSRHFSEGIARSAGTQGQLSPTCPPTCPGAIMRPTFPPGPTAVRRPRSY